AGRAGLVRGRQEDGEPPLLPVPGRPVGLRPGAPLRRQGGVRALRRTGGGLRPGLAEPSLRGPERRLRHAATGRPLSGRRAPHAPPPRSRGFISQGRTTPTTCSERSRSIASITPAAISSFVFQRERSPSIRKPSTISR